MFRFALVLVGLVAIACTSALVTMHFAIHGTEVTVPDLRGLTTPAAMQKGALGGLDVHVGGKLYSTALAAGRVVAQTPQPGAVVRRDWMVRVEESLGPERVRIPRALGQQEGAASMAVRRLGLELGTVARMPDPLAAPGTVLAQDPAPDAEGVEQPAVGLLIAETPTRDPAAWVMPNWVGVQASTAQGELARAGLPPATEHDAAGAAALGAAPGAALGAALGAGLGAGSGTVVRQSPLAGARLTAGMPVVLEVAR